MALALRSRAALAIGALLTAPPLMAQDGTWALTNARIETVTRGVIERGTVVIRDGLIEAVGPAVQPPADARVVDLTGRTVFPGLIDLTSTLGLPSPPPPTGGPGSAAAPGAQGSAQAQPQFVGLEPGRVIANELRPSAGDLRAAREAGLTAALIAPARGAFRGLSALVPMRDDSAAQMVVRSPVALHMGFQGVSAGGFGGRYPATLLGVIAYERQTLYDAQRHAQLMDRYRTGARGVARPSYDADLDALVPVVRGTLPAFFAANTENDIRRATRIAKEFGLKHTIVGATEGFRSVDLLRAAQGVVVSVDFPRPTEVTGWSYRSSLRRAPDDSAAAAAEVVKMLEGNAASLHRAGLRFALASGGLRPNEFLANVRKAIAAGLPRDAALEALTIRAATVAGAGEQLGSIEPGKIANLVVAERDILSDSARVRMVFVDGMRYEIIAPAPGAARRSAAAGAVGPEMAQVAGSWSFTVTTPQGTNQGTMTVTQSGATMEGSMVTELGTVQIADGRISGRTASWSITLPIGGQTTVIQFRGTVEGNRMSGSVDLGAMGSATFTAEKTP